MFLLVGLCNPGPEYSGTRHNIGFDATNAIAKSYSFPSYVNKFSSHFCAGSIDGKKASILIPGKYMNNSGIPVSEAANFYKIPLENIIVFHDDLNLELGRVKVKTGGGNGGHNGLKSITKHVGNDYTRVRIGIGHPGDKDEVSDYVLSTFFKKEKKIKEEVIDGIAENAEYLISYKHDKFMSRIAEKINLKEKNDGI